MWDDGRGRGRGVRRKHGDGNGEWGMSSSGDWGQWSGRRDASALDGCLRCEVSEVLCYSRFNETGNRIPCVIVVYRIHWPLILGN